MYYLCILSTSPGAYASFILIYFKDLAVKSEGTFTLRYRIFDLFSPNLKPHQLSESPSGGYPDSFSALSIPPTFAPTYASESSSLNPDSSSFTSAFQSCFQSHFFQNSNHISPYLDGSQDYAISSAMPQHPIRHLQEPGESSGHHPVFTSHEAQTQIEPNERDATLDILAECWAKGSFRIYSTKEFPGLPALTDLTKVQLIWTIDLAVGLMWRIYGIQQLAKWGVRLNIRETERRRRRYLLDLPEEEASSDGGTDDAIETTKPMKGQPRPLQKTKNIKPRPPQTRMIPYQVDHNYSDDLVTFNWTH